MHVKVNGRHTEIERDIALAELLRRFDVAEDAVGVAVAVNEAVVPRHEWPSLHLQDRDVVEIIRAVQGG